jgi:hypothetical protein
VTEVAAVEGVVRYMYSDGPDAERCICCKGPHVFSRYIEGVDNSGGGWVFQQLHNVPDGTRVRLVLTEVQSPTPCGRIVADGHAAYDPDCGACREANSDAPEWTIR